MYAIIKLKNQRHPTYILKNTLGMSHVQNTSFFKRESFLRKHLTYCFLQTSTEGLNPVCLLVQASFVDPPQAVP